MASAIGPDFVALQVRDMEKAAGFFEDILGLERVPQSPPDAIVFKTRPIPFALRKPLVDLDAASHLGWGVALWIACDDAAALHEKAVANGVPILVPPGPSPFGVFFTCRGPEGYGLTLHTAEVKG
jgi:predicted enzyme related to lactoylglutathione lyase